MCVHIVDGWHKEGNGYECRISEEGRCIFGQERWKERSNQAKELRSRKWRLQIQPFPHVPQESHLQIHWQEDSQNCTLRYVRHSMLFIIVFDVGINILQQVKPKKPVTIEKKISGDKNGEKRIVLLKKRRANYPTADPVTVHHAKKCFRDHQRYLRPTLKPGTICVLLAGAHKGKRVVFLKQLKSGLLLITGKVWIHSFVRFPMNL